jgi:hypothetical protein
VGLTLKGAKILDLCTSGAELFSRLASSFARFATGPFELSSVCIEPGIVRNPALQQSRKEDPGGKLL